jgi:hypothetical protein
MMEDFGSGKITQAQVVQGLAKWSEDAQDKKLEQALDKMINPEPISIDPVMFRASLKRKAEGISKSPSDTDARVDDGVQPAQEVQVIPVPPFDATNGSETTLHKWNKAIIDDIKAHTNKCSAKFFYRDQSDIAAVSYGMDTLFIYTEMCHRLREIIEEKVCDPLESSGLASLSLIQKLLGLTDFVLHERLGSVEELPGKPTSSMWEVGLRSFKCKIGNKKTDYLKRFAAHIQYLEGKPFWRIIEASPRDIERLARQMDDESLRKWLWK